MALGRVKIQNLARVVDLEWCMVIGKGDFQRHLENVFPNTLSHQRIHPNLTIVILLLLKKSSFSPSYILLTHISGCFKNLAITIVMTITTVCMVVIMIMIILSHSWFVQDEDRRLVKESHCQ